MLAPGRCLGTISRGNARRLSPMRAAQWFDGLRGPDHAVRGRGTGIGLMVKRAWMAAAEALICIPGSRRPDFRGADLPFVQPVPQSQGNQCSPKLRAALRAGTLRIAKGDRSLECGS